MCATEELPDWHIEVKGTKSPTLDSGKLLSWYEQIVRDCPKSLFPMIIHKANSWDYVTIIPYEVWIKFDFQRCDYQISTEKSVQPAHELTKLDIRREVFKGMCHDSIINPAPLSMVVHPIYVGVSMVLLAMLWAVEWVRLISAKKIAVSNMVEDLKLH